MYYKLSLILLILCLIWRTETIVIRITQEKNWHKGGNYTELCGIPCVHAENPPNPDAEFFIAMNDNDVRNAFNRQSNVQIRILGSEEPTHYYSLLKLEYLNTHFHGSAVLDWNSDIPWVLMPNMDTLKQIQFPEDPIPKVTFVARNWLPMNGREAYVRVIDSLIGIVAPGNRYHNTEWPKCEERDCSKVEAIRKYKIHLAFENGDSPNFVTDKIYQAFEAGVLPVWMGTRDVSEAVPKGSYIDVADFDSPKSLALYLAKVLADDALYHSYFEWKYKPFDKEFEDRFRVLWSEPFHCRLCRYVDAYKNDLEWDQYKQKATTNQVKNRRVVLTADKSNIGIIRAVWYVILCVVLFFVVICFRKQIYSFSGKLAKRF